MKPSATPILCAVNLGLCAALTWLWIQPDGTLRDTRWVPPAPIPPNLAQLLPEMPAAPKADGVDQFMAILERPVFSATRRPPPPPPPPPPPAPPPPPPPPPDPLANAVLSGIYGGPEGGGIIVQSQGQSRIVRLKETLGEWQVQSIDERSVTLKRGAQTRILRVIPLRELPPAGASAPASAPTPSTPARPAPRVRTP